MSADADPPDRRPGLHDAVAALRHRDFALFWSGALVSNTGGWVQNVTVPFVVFELTGSAAWVGFAGFAQFFAVWLTGPAGGSLSDRFDRRRVLIVTQVVMAALAFALWAMWAAGVRSPGAIVAMTALTGLVAGLNIGSWQAFVSELVPREDLLNAVTLNSAQFNAARAFGPALGGVVLATLGPGWSFFINGATFGAVILALVLIRTSGTVEKQEGRVRVLRDLARTARYVRSQPGIAAAVTAVLALGFLGSPVFTLIVVFTEDVFHVGDGAFGLMSAALGLGAVLGTPLVAGRGSGMLRSRLAGGAMLVYGAALVSFGLAPTYAFGLLALLVAGAGYLAIASTLNTTIQLQVDETMRGKVLSFYVMGLTLSAPLGNLVQGWATEWVGPRVTVAVSGSLFLALAGAQIASGRLRRFDDDGTPSDSAATVSRAAPVR